MTSIRQRLTSLLIAHLVAGVALAGVLLWLRARHSVLAQFDATLLARAELLQATIEEDDGHLEIEFNLGKLPEFRSEESRVLFQIRTRDGAPLITSPGFEALAIPESLWEREALPAFVTFRTPSGEPWRGLKTRFDAADDVDGNFRGLELRVAGSSKQAQRSLARLALLTPVFAALGIGILIFLVKRSLNRGLRPLEEVAARTGEIDLARLPWRLDVADAPSELRLVVEKLNELLDRVHESLRRERRFTRDVAHELRTPVAELKSLAELARRWEDQAGPAAFSDVGEIAAEMENLVSALTLLNRLDAGAVTPATTDVPLLPLVRQIVDRNAAAAAAGGLEIAVPEEAAGVTWTTDPVLWKIAATNLIENAISYSPRGSMIRITVTPSVFAVINPAPELTTSDIGRMTDAFWRKSESRSDLNHSGLGLSIVASIARTLGLDLRLTWEDGHLVCALGPHPKAGIG